jgi:N-dimethylarginine dimethylaminohydrolase
MFVETFTMAPRTLLRTLDNLHLACLLTMLREGQTIHYMVTADEELLKARKKMTELTSVPVASPRDLLNIEPL